MKTSARLQANTVFKRVLKYKCNVFKFDLRDNFVSLDQIICLFGASINSAWAKRLWLALIGPQDMG